MPTNPELELMKESFLAMGYSEKEAEIMAKGRGEPRFPQELPSDEHATTIPAGMTDQKEVKRFLMLDQNGKGIAICEAMDQVDAELYGWRHLIDQGFLGRLRELKSGEYGSTEANLPQAFKEAEAAEAGDDYPAFFLVDKNGKDFKAIKAPTQKDAEAHAKEHEDRYAKLRPMTAQEWSKTNLARDIVPSAEAALGKKTDESLYQSFLGLGLSERAARLAAQGRDRPDSSYPSLPVHQVPYQAPDPRFASPGHPTSHFPLHEVRLNEKGKR